MKYLAIPLLIVALAFIVKGIFSIDSIWCNTLPSGVYCHEAGVQQGVFFLSRCSDGKTYVNPPEYKRLYCSEIRKR